MSSCCRSGLCSLLHSGDRHGWLLFPPAEGAGVRHCHVRQRDWHLRVGASGAAAHWAVLLEGGAARPQRLRCQPLRVWGAAPTNYTAGGWGESGGRWGGVSGEGETWWGVELHITLTISEHYEHSYRILYWYCWYNQLCAVGPSLHKYTHRTNRTHMLLLSNDMSWANVETVRHSSADNSDC